MQSPPSSVMGIAALLNGIAAEATQTRSQLLRANMPFHMPELGVDLKVALTASPQGSQVEVLSGATLKRVAPSAIQTRFVAVDAPSIAVSPKLVHHDTQGNTLNMQFQLFTQNAQVFLDASGLPSLEVNIDRSLSAQVNGRALGEPDHSAHSRVTTPRVDADTQGIYHVSMTLAQIDRQAKFALALDLCGQRSLVLVQAE